MGEIREYLSLKSINKMRGSRVRVLFDFFVPLITAKSAPLFDFSHQYQREKKLLRESMNR